MRKSVKYSGLWGTLLTLLSEFAVILMLLGACTQLLLQAKIGEGTEKWVVFAALVIAIVLVHTIFAAVSKSFDYINIAISSAGLLFLMFVMGLLADGRFVYLIWNAFAVIIGSMISCAVCMKMKENRSHRKRRYG